MKCNSVLCQKQRRMYSIPYILSNTGTLPHSWKQFIRLGSIPEGKQESAKCIINKNRSKIYSLNSLNHAHFLLKVRMNVHKWFFRVFITFLVLNINNTEEMQDTSMFIVFFKNGTNSHELLFFQYRCAGTKLRRKMQHTVHLCIDISGRISGVIFFWNKAITDNFYSLYCSWEKWRYMLPLI